MELAIGCKKSAALMFQSCRVLIWHEKELLNDGFFSFAVVRQSIRYLPSNTFLKERTLQLSKIPWIFKLKNLDFFHYPYLLIIV